MKRCYSCRVEKPNNYFDKNKGMSDGRINKCKSCVREYNKQYREIPKNRYKEKERKRLAFSSLSKKEKRSLRYLRRYGISIDEYAELYRKQNGVCAICKSKETGHKKRLSVDHCHETGEIRGLLCNSCNVGLGRFKDSIDLLTKAIEYLNS